MAVKPKTVLLMGSCIRKKAKAEVALTAGELVERDATTGDWQHPATQGGNASPMFVLERDELGEEIDTVIPIGEQAEVGFFTPGSEVYAWLEPSQTIARGDLLEPGAAGGLQKHTPQAVAEGGTANYTIYARAPVARALEAVTTTATRARITVEVL